MDEDKFQSFVDNCWNYVFKKVAGAAVYIDHASAECLHWYTGDRAYMSLKDAGAISVHELAMYNFQYANVTGTKKAVVISTSANPAFYRRTLKMIIEKNVFESCTIICAAQDDSIDNSLPCVVEDRIDYEKIKRDVKEWMMSKNPLQECFVEIIFKPIFIAFINENTFVTPPFCNMMPSIKKTTMEEIAIDAEQFINLLNSLFEHLNVKEDIFSLGNLSKYLADKLNNLPGAVTRRNNHKGVTNNVSLILVDRTLDLCAATCNSTESILGRILSTLPHLPNHFNDIAVDISPLLYESKGNVRPVEITGCLATTDRNMMDILISKKQKEVLLTMNKILVDITTKESPKTKIPTRVSAHSLEKLVEKIRDMNNSNLNVLSVVHKRLQIILAIIQTLKSDKTMQIELLVSIEKLVLQNLAVSRDSSIILAQVSNIIKTRASKGLDMENLLALLIHIFALAGTEIRFSEQQIYCLQEAIAEAIQQDIKIFNENLSSCKMNVYQQTLILLGVTEEESVKKMSKKIAEDIINILSTVVEQRAELHNYKSLITRPSPQEMVHCVGVLEQLVTDIVHPDKPDLPDLHPKSSSVISSGFNFLLKGKSRNHPLDNPLILIYVVGGITSEEIRKIQEIVSVSKTNCRVILAGSRLLKPLDIVDKIILSNLSV